MTGAPDGRRVIDCHVHALPGPAMHAFRASLSGGDLSEGPPRLWGSEAFASPPLQVEALDRAGIETAVLTFSSNAPAALHALAKATGRGAAETVRAVNRELAGWAASSAGRLLPTAWVDPRLGDDALAEMERAVWEDGVVGFSTLCSFLPIGGPVGEPVQGPGELEFLDSPRFAPALELAASLGVPLFVHAGGKYRLAVGDPAPQPAALVFLTGGLSMPVEITLCVLRLLMAGTFERLPGLRVVLGQLGGLFPFLLSRLELVSRLVAGPGASAMSPRLAEGALAHLREHCGQIYVDTHSMDAPAIVAALELLGDRNVVFGSDFPVTPQALGREGPLEMLANLRLDPGTLGRILAGNAEALLPATARPAAVSPGVGPVGAGGGRR
jgi:predicted TIM-barrel fold metal-dependent hydrolase